MNKKEKGTAGGGIKKIIGGKRFRYGSLSVLLTVVFIAVVITANAVITALFSRYMVYTDLTSSELYSLSDEAVTFLDRLNNDIEIKFALPEDTIKTSARMTMIYTCAKAYEEATRDMPYRVTVNCYDAFLYPSEFADYKNLVSSDWADTNVVVESANGTPIVYTVDSFFTTDSSASEELGFSGERRFLSGFLQLAGVEKPVICFTTGHGEPIGTDTDEASNEYRDFFRMLNDWGFELKRVDLQREELDENCRLVIVLDPKTDFMSKELTDLDGVSEIDKIARYMSDKYGSMMVFKGAQGRDFPVLDEYLEEWNVRIDSTKTIVESDTNTISTDGRIFTVNYSDEARSATFTEKFGNLRTVFSNAAPVTLIPINDQNSSIGTSTIFFTSSSANAVTDSQTQQVGRYSLLTMSTRLRYLENESMYSYVVACGSPEMLKYCSSKSYANREIMYVLTQKIQTVKIPVDLDYKPYEDNGLPNITSEAVRVWTVILAAVIPAAVMAVGCVVVIRRKRK